MFVDSADSGVPHSYISLFSGIGGLESSTQPAQVYCEIDEDSRRVLKNRLLSRGWPTPLHDDVTTLSAPPRADFVVGGWPCQDLSIAGRQAGLVGKRSSLFFEMLRVASAAGAHTIIGENVPHMLTIHYGQDFALARDAVMAAGFRHFSWRILNARQFSLPQDRSRLFVVASKHQSYALALHAETPQVEHTTATPHIAGFYWTGGTHSICFSPGFVPTIKVGASDGRGRGTVAVFDGVAARKLTVDENLNLQGFAALPKNTVPGSALLRMAGNAVPLPMGSHVVDSVMEQRRPSGDRLRGRRGDSSGYTDGGFEWSVTHNETPLASNLGDYLDGGHHEPLSPQACAGLLVRVVRARRPIPAQLFDYLYVHSTRARHAKHPSRSDSLATLARMMPDVVAFRNNLQDTDWSVVR